MIKILDENDKQEIEQRIGKLSHEIDALKNSQNYVDDDGYLVLGSTTTIDSDGYINL